MSESRPQKRKIEFIESYWTGGEYGSDYIWNDNHGELIRCKDCKHYHKGFNCDLMQKPIMKDDEWFCADGERKDN